jgi:transcriptional regulator with XRE-family HTH domain
MKTWQEKIQELESAGWSMKKLAQHIGISPGGMSDLKSGRSGEPRGMVAVKLYRVHKNVCEKE